MSCITNSAYNNIRAGTVLILNTFYSLSLSTVSQPIDLTLCSSSIWQFFFFRDLSVQSSRLLLCTWLKKEIDILCKDFNPYPAWSRRESCYHDVAFNIYLNNELCNIQITGKFTKHKGNGWCPQTLIVRSQASAFTFACD